MTMDHETCSSRLPLFARGELSAPDRSALEAHLAECADCTRELVAVRALMTLPEVHLTGDERRALHRAVLAPPPRRWARLAPAFGAVGLILVVALGAVSFLPIEDRQPPAIQDAQGGGDEAEISQDTGEATTRLERDRGAEKAAARPGGTEDTGAGAVAGQTGTSEAFSVETLGVVTTFSAADLGPHLLAYDGSVAFDDADRSLPAALREFRRNAPDAGPQLSECTNIVQDAYQSVLVPSFASVYPADRLLVMGFVFQAGTEQRYAFWGWHLGDCSRPTPIYVTGVLP
ncbi:MAG: zf-HC2 domain-containing protein [Actinomycetota bacterium]|nr:zf-HC2 domain-containing protein [Actinomycetota bacterium]